MKRYPSDSDRSLRAPRPTLADAAELLGRRDFVRMGTSALAISYLAGTALGAEGEPPRLCAARDGKRAFSFDAVPVSTHDDVRVPAGYHVQVLYAWGDPVNGHAPAFQSDASQSWQEQEQQAGMAHDGMQWIPLPDAPQFSERGLLVMNHEYADQGLLYAHGLEDVKDLEAVKKSQAAHGVSIIQVARGPDGHWHVESSTLSRRITAYTPMRLSGPAKGAEQVRTSADPSGNLVLGTVNNCASGMTPWNTYLACEENFQGVFGSKNAAYTPRVDEKRYGLTKAGYQGTLDGKSVSVYRWWEFDARFDLADEPNEANRFGYVVEIDPYQPQSAPVKRTAFGALRHENAAVTLAADGRVVVYMGDDEKNEYIYKFVSNRRVDPRNRAANADLLDEGTLYAARFDDNGKGAWLALKHGMNSLTPANGFQLQADICIRTRQAADRVGATPMDRPEWVAVHPDTGEVYVTLTNNDSRGSATPLSASNPRPNNVYGHILRWREKHADAAATEFEWCLFLLAGDPQQPDESKHGTIEGDAFGSPDGLWFDRRGILWIQTDVSTKAMAKPDYKNLGNNMMLAADPQTGEVRRFLTGPLGCEVTGMTLTPDLTTMFVNIQHPGEPESDVSDPAHPQAISSWPDGPMGGRPRSATIAITRTDGGPIGT